MALDPPGSLVLHSSWRGRILALLAPALVLGFGGLGVVGGGLRFLPGVILAFGLVLLLVVVVDYPLWSMFGPEAIERRCLVRTERLPWSRVVVVGRPATSGRFGRFGRSTTGLVATVGRRRYLLTDRMESRAENQALLRVMAAWAPGTPVEATQPPEDWPPTWLHKRRKGPAGSLIDQV